MRDSPECYSCNQEAEVKRLREELAYWKDDAGPWVAEVERLRAQVGRLRKAVTWLTGALPDDSEFDWERARSAVVLEDTGESGPATV